MGQTTECSKTDCKAPATHTLVIEEGPHGERRLQRCLPHAKADLKMIPLVHPDAKLFVLENRAAS